jgi:hypothetical protein
VRSSAADLPLAVLCSVSVDKAAAVALDLLSSQYSYDSVGFSYHTDYRHSEVGKSAQALASVAWVPSVFQAHRAPEPHYPLLVSEKASYF